MLEILVIADDLTGAAEGAAAGAAHGLEAIVLRGNETVPPDTQVLAIDAATRGMTVDDAAARTADLMGVHGGRRPRVLYKKMDSTLRGHVGAELAAVLRVWRGLDPAQGSAVVILAPAFPANGRTTLGGRQHVNESVLPQDLAAMVGAAGLRAALVGRGQVQAADVRAAEAASADVWICDAETEEDLRAVAAMAASRGPSVVWAGSGGLARHAPAAIGLEREPRVGRNAARSMGPILFVIGSLCRVAHEQVSDLRAEGDVCCLEIAPATLASGPGSPDWSASTAGIDAAVEAGHDVVLSIASLEKSDETEDPRLAMALARFAAPHAKRSGGLVLTGGDTARSVLDTLGIGWLRVVGEIEPGVSVCFAGSSPRPIVTKAGAFGDRQTLRRCRTAMKARA
jgi:D-threonate/D-erythronate kinase